MSEFAEIQAERSYAKQFEAAQSTGNAYRAMVAKDELRAARSTLEPQDQAIMDQIAGRGRSLTDIAQRTGRSVDDLKALYLGAREKLAEHYQSTAAA